MHEVLSITIGDVTYWGNSNINHIKERAEGYKDITIEEGKVVVTFEDEEANPRRYPKTSGSVTTYGDALSAKSLASRLIEDNVTAK